MATPTELGIKDNSVPMSWADAKTAISSESTLYFMGREPTALAHYLASMESIKTKYSSVEDFLRITKFDFDSRTDSVTGEATAVRTDSSPTSSPVQIKLELNDYPYHFSPGIVHWVIWKLNGSPLTPADIELETDKLRKDGATETLYWINPPHLKSIKDLDHAHILARHA